jgi:tetratricopeptide (TPR) repeat protein
MSDAHPKIAAGVAAVRMLASRPDLTRKKRQRQRATSLGAAVGRHAAAIELLAGWLNTNTDQDVGDLESLLEDRVTVHLAGLAPDLRDAVDLQDLRAQLAMELGWKALRGHGPREVLKVLVLAGEAGAPRPTVETVARAGSGAVDDVLAACFAVTDGGRVKLGVGLRDFVAAREEPLQAQRERVQRWLDGVRADLDAGVEAIEPAAAEAMDFALAEDQTDLAAALALSLAGRLRVQGKLDDARRRALRGMDRLSPGNPRSAAIRSALEFELALIALAAGDPHAAFARLEAADQGLVGARSSDQDAAAALTHRIAIARAQALLASGSAPQAAAKLVALERPGEPGSMDIVRLQTLAAARLQAGDAAGALGAVREAADLVERALPVEAPIGASVALTMAQAARAVGVDTASDTSALLEQARILAGGNLDRPASPTLAIALHELGVVAAGRGDFEGAATLLDEASMLAASLLPRRHPLRCTISYTRGLLFLAVGERDRAERHLERATEGWEKLGAASHPAAILARAARSWVETRERGRRGREAAADLSESVSALAAALGDEDDGVRRLRELQRRIS